MGGLLVRSDHLNNCSDATFQQYCNIVQSTLYTFILQDSVPIFGHFQLTPLNPAVAGYSYPTV